jgi:hypothetical protein
MAIGVDGRVRAHERERNGYNFIFCNIIFFAAYATISNIYLHFLVTQKKHIQCL